MSAEWFRHDAKARFDSKLTTLRADFGWAAIGQYWALVEILCEQDDHRISVKLLKGIALDLGIEGAELRRLLAACVDVGLFETDETAWWSAGLTKRLVAIESHREAKRIAALEREEKKRLAKSATGGTTVVPQSGHNASTLLLSNTDPSPSLSLGGEPERGTQRIPLTESEYQGLLMNHWHSDEKTLLDDIAHATDICAKNGFVPQDSPAYMRTFLRNKAKFAARDAPTLAGQIVKVSQNVINAHNTQQVVDAYKKKAREQSSGKR